MVFSEPLDNILILQNDRHAVSTESGPGSPRGQPAWGSGCDRVTILAILILEIGGDPVATALGTDLILKLRHSFKVPGISTLKSQV